MTAAIAEVNGPTFGDGGAQAVFGAIRGSCICGFLSQELTLLASSTRTQIALGAL
jgi:hypothetical protein